MMGTGNDTSHSHSGNPPQKGQTVEGTEAQMAKTQRREHPRQRNRHCKGPGLGLLDVFSLGCSGG